MKNFGPYKKRVQCKECKAYESKDRYGWFCVVCGAEEGSFNLFHNVMGRWTSPPFYKFWDVEWVPKDEN